MLKRNLGGSDVWTMSSLVTPSLKSKPRETDLLMQEKGLTFEFISRSIIKSIQIRQISNHSRKTPTHRRSWFRWKTFFFDFWRTVLNTQSFDWVTKGNFRWFGRWSWGSRVVCFPTHWRAAFFLGRWLVFLQF